MPAAAVKNVCNESDSLIPISSLISSHNSLLSLQCPYSYSASDPDAHVHVHDADSDASRTHPSHRRPFLPSPQDRPQDSHYSHYYDCGRVFDNVRLHSRSYSHSCRCCARSASGGYTPRLWKTGLSYRQHRTRPRDRGHGHDRDPDQDQDHDRARPRTLSRRCFRNRCSCPEIESVSGWRRTNWGRACARGGRRSGRLFGGS